MSGRRGGMYGRDAIYHLLVQTTVARCLKFFHGGYLEDRLKPGNSYPARQGRDRQAAPGPADDGESAN